MARTATAAPPAPPAPLPADLTEALRRLKLGTVRRLAPEVLHTAKVQRWTPEEVLRALIEAECASRDESNLRNRLRGAGFPVAKSLEEFKVAASSGAAGHVRLPGRPGMDIRGGESLSGRPSWHRQEPLCRSSCYADLTAELVAGQGDRAREVGIIRVRRERRAGCPALGSGLAWCRVDWSVRELVV
jgi:hypothetical protein